MIDKPREGAGETVFIVDDDDAIRSSLSFLLESFGYEPRSFASGEAFLERCAEALPESCMVILDLSMPGMDGLAVQSALAEGGIDAPIVFLSGDGDIPAAVDAVRHGAIDFMEKPVDSGILLKRVQTALANQSDRLRAHRNVNEVRSRMDTLTPREKEVLECIAEGQTSKVIAVNLGISERTVELHRSHVLKKMGVRNTTELLNHVLPTLEAGKQTGQQAGK